MKKEILIICPPFLPVPDIKGGAVESLVTQLIDCNEEKGYSLTVVTTYHKEIDYNRYKKTKFIFVDKKIMSLSYIIPLRVLLRLYAKVLCKKINFLLYDIVIVENEFVIGEVIHKKTGTLSLLHLHNNYINDHTYKCLQHFCGIIAVSDYVLNSLKKYNPNIPMYVVNNGIDFSKFICNSSEKYQKLTFVFAGRISPEKGVIESIKAFNKAFNNNSNIQFLIIGGKSHHQKKYYKKVLKEVNSIDNVSYLGYLSKEEMSKVYSKSHVGVIPSVWEEPFGLALVEQMYMSLPVICSRKGAFTFILGNDYSLYISPSNINEFSKIMMDIYNGQYDLKNIGDNNHKLSLKYSKENYCDSFFRLIDLIDIK